MCSQTHTEFKAYDFSLQFYSNKDVLAGPCCVTEGRGIEKIVGIGGEWQYHAARNTELLQYIITESLFFQVTVISFSPHYDLRILVHILSQCAGRHSQAQHDHAASYFI